MEASELKVDHIDIPEISKTKRAAFTPRDPHKRYLLGCGDDRSLTPESIRELQARGIEHPEIFVRYFGGAIGAARVAGVAIIERYGREALHAYGGDFEKFVLDITQRIESTNKLKPAVHSAGANEGNPQRLSEHESDNEIGCAYAKLLGAVTALNTDDATVRVAASEARSMTQAEVDTAFTSIIAANNILADNFSIDTATGFDRHGFRRLGVPSMILAGNHATVREDKVKAVINFEPDVISSPNNANQTGEPFYNNDVTIVAEALMRALPEFRLDPRKLLDIMVEDIAATRQALASSEDLTAPDLSLERNGSLKEAVAYLESVRV